MSCYFHSSGPLLLSYFLFILFSLSGTEKSWSSRLVVTKQGLTRGFIFLPKGESYDGVEVFLGLPYASPPLGSLRFMPPVSGSPWSGTKMNEFPAPVCPQVFPLYKSTKRTLHLLEEEGEEGESESASFSSDEGFVGINETDILRSMPRGRLSQLKRLEPFLKNQSEDCLFINIWVPLSVSEGKVDRPLPVLMFVHGEDFSYGAGHPYDPSMLVSVGNVIVINFNFRLGILGFLNANSDGYFKSPANFALLDQVAALQWVQENIGSFGGDKNNITLMGHGKGAMYVNFLMISNALPSSDGEGQLFHRVILMSGSALSPMSVGLSYGKDLAKKLSGRFKCPIEPPSNMLQCLRQLPLQYFLDSDLWKYFGPSDDGVVIEGGIRENIMRDKISRFPLLFGVTRAEFLPNLSEHDAVYGIESEKRREVFKQFIDGVFSSPYRSEILAAAVHEYTDWERPVQHPISVRDETLDALGDAQIVAPMIKVGELHESRTYFYVFEYQSKVSSFVQRLGCVPGEDVGYVFGVPLYLDGESTSPSLGIFSGNFTKNEIQLSHSLVQYWANFIKTGNPNGELVISNPDGESASGNRLDKSSSNVIMGTSTSKPKLIEWPPYDSLFKKYLSIEAKPRIRNHYRAHKISFWLHLVPELMKSGSGNGNGGISVFQMEGDHNGHIMGSNTSNIQHPPSIQLVGPRYWEQHPFYLTPGSRPHHPLGEGGIQIYSTALSVTIAVGCSFLILNIMVFAIFYYLKDKRRNRRSECQSQQMSTSTNPLIEQNEPHPLNYHEHHLSSHNTPVRTRHKENGQVPNSNAQTLPMPNISGDLPISNLQQYMQSPQAQTLPNQKQRTPTVELSMPDAILAAAMMLNYRQHRATSNPNKPPLNMKEQLLRSGGVPPNQIPSGGRSSSSSGASSSAVYELENVVMLSSKTVPRPPKRHTPTVKFSPDTYISSSSANTGSPGQLKSSLKKHSSYQQEEQEQEQGQV